MPWDIIVPQLFDGGVYLMLCQGIYTMFIVTQQPEKRKKPAVQGQISSQNKGLIMGIANSVFLPIENHWRVESWIELSG